MASKHALLAISVAIALTWLAVTLVTYSTAIPIGETALSLPFPSLLKAAPRSFLTQGWSFFTKSPRDPDFYLFTRGPEGWQNASRGPSSRPDSLFGLIRSARVQGLELGLVTGQLGGKAWINCESAVEECLHEQTPIVITNPSHAPILCGELGVAFREPLPWAWVGLIPREAMPSQVALLQIECS